RGQGNQGAAGDEESPDPRRVHRCQRIQTRLQNRYQRSQINCSTTITAANAAPRAAGARLINRILIHGGTGLSQGGFETSHETSHQTTSTASTAGPKLSGTITATPAQDLRRSLQVAFIPRTY